MPAEGLPGGHPKIGAQGPRGHGLIRERGAPRAHRQCPGEGQGQQQGPGRDGCGCNLPRRVLDAHSVRGDPPAGARVLRGRDRARYMRGAPVLAPSLVFSPLRSIPPILRAPSGPSTPQRLRNGKNQNFKPVRIHTLAAFWETGACHSAFPIHFSHRGTPDGKNDIIFPMTKKQVWFQSHVEVIGVYRFT